MIRLVTGFGGIVFAKSIIASPNRAVLPNRKRVLSLVLRGQVPRHHPETDRRRAHSDLPISSFFCHSSFELRHFYQAALCNSSYSHALAKTQSRRTVTVEIFRTSAISSCLRPPKYFNSTT